MNAVKPSVISGRPTVAEINLDALVYNYRQIAKRIPRGTKIMGVVKADAYGHGALQVSLELERLGVEYLGVAISDEAIALRKGGVKTPILILSGEFSPEDADRIVQYDLTPVVFERESLDRLSKAAKRLSKKVKVHVKVDTGMARLGASMNNWFDFVRDLKRFPDVDAEGVLSHFAMTDEDGGSFSRDQWKEFQKAVDVVRGADVCCRYRHMANSGNLAASPLYAGNLVRPGIMLYGSYPSPKLRDLITLRPVMTLKTCVHYLKTVPPGTPVSYGGTFVTKRESVIATLPVGYADGYSRNLSNRGEVLIRKRRAPVVGRVCMDLMMVDVTDIPGVRVGDDVVLIGKQGKERITAEEIAAQIGSISYEVFCSIGKRVPRIYEKREVEVEVQVKKKKRIQDRLKKAQVEVKL